MAQSWCILAFYRVKPTTSIFFNAFPSLSALPLQFWASWKVTGVIWIVAFLIIIIMLPSLKNIWVLQRNLYLFFSSKKAQVNKPLNTTVSNSTNIKKEMAKDSQRENVRSHIDKEPRIAWKKYGKEVSDILQSKKQLLDIDIVFIANKISRSQLALTQQLASCLKLHVKTLKEVDFSLLPQLLDFNFSIGIVSPPHLFINTYVQYFRNNTFTIEQNQSLAFPSYFLKRVGMAACSVCFGRSIDEGALALRFFGSILSLNQLKKVDEVCCGKASKMSADQVVRLLSIFRQLRKTGAFVELAQQVLIQKQAELTSKSLIMALISFLELGNRDALSKLQPTITERVKSALFAESEVVSVLHLLHKYKAGGLPLWQAIQGYLASKYKKIPFEHIFLVMGGLCRNYKLSGDLLIQLIQYDPTLKYAEQLQEKQFVEFYFVLYAHFSTLADSLQHKYESLLLSSVSANKLKSVYCQIQAFFLFLFESSQHLKNEHLRKTYPDDTLIALLSSIFSFPNADNRERDAYEQDLVSRYGQQIWKRHRGVVVAEEFIRYKLITTVNKEWLRESVRE